MDSLEGQEEGCCEYINKHLGSMKDLEFIKKKGDYRLPMKYFILLN